jgi:hypothetical protein
MRSHFNSIIFRIKKKIKIFLFHYGIYFLPPAQPLSSSVEVRVLLGHQFLTMFMYSLDSFFQAIGNVLPVLVVDDGSLTQQDKALLTAKFTVRIYTQEQLLNEVFPLIKNCTYLRRYFTDKNTHIKKLRVASMLLPAKRMILYEADVLFLRPSPEIKRWVTASSNTGRFLKWDWFTIDFLRKCDFADLSFRKLVAKSLDLKMPHFFNAGVLLLPKMTQSNIHALEKACRLFYEIEYIDHRFCDELLLAVAFDTDKDRPFNPKYYTTVWSEADYKLVSPDAVLIHYAGEAKELLKTDVVKKWVVVKR